MDGNATMYVARPYPVVFTHANSDVIVVSVVTALNQFQQNATVVIPN